MALTKLLEVEASLEKSKPHDLPSDLMAHLWQIISAIYH